MSTTSHPSEALAHGHGFSFAVGRAAGWLVAPVFGLVSFMRQARTFHPRGVTLHATVRQHPELRADYRALAARLCGEALVRFSGAIWKRNERLPDVLGCAMRLTRGSADRAEASAEDQDLLFATIRRPWSMIFAPFTTDVRDYFANDYFAVSPFDLGLLRPVYLHLHPAHACRVRSGTRAERLQQEMALGTAQLTLDLGEGPYGPWIPLLTINLERISDVDSEALRFNPFRTGRDVRPIGFIHALRLGAYAVSQSVRPTRQVQASVSHQPYFQPYRDGTRSAWLR